MKRKIYEIINPAEDKKSWSFVYDLFMIIVIIVSLIPLAIKDYYKVLDYLEIFCTAVFIIDYLFRLITADIKLNKGFMSYLIYPFTPMALIDLISLLPSITMLNAGFKVLKVFRLLRTLRALRVFKSFRYSKNITIIANVFKRQKDSLLVVLALTIGYVLVSSLIIFNLEPESFETYLDAVYWAVIPLTNIGYGTNVTVTAAGKIITMISSILAILIVALPVGIITAGYMEEISENEKE
ncbi:MAG: ion transporter [Erysipelotrichaceae bacterium]|nr:ion transporter [Erysipelotrichaceae bacterium]